MKAEFLHTRLPLAVRFVIAFVFYAIVALLQVLMVRGGGLPLFVLRFAGIALLIIPLWFLKTKNFSNRPKLDKAPVKKAKAGKSKSIKEEKGTWKAVSMTEIDRLRDWIGTVRKVKIPFFYSRAFGALATFITFFVIVFSVVLTIFSGSVGFFIILDLYLIVFPFLYFARIEKWVPAISSRLDYFTPVLNAELPGSLRLSPSLLFDKNGGDNMPSDIRLMVAPGANTPQEIRNELLGAQFQLACNNGPNGEVPYIYAVFITKGMGAIWQVLKEIKSARYITEPGSSAEGDETYGTVVFRQDTKCRSDGYHTNESDVRELLGLVVKSLEAIV